MKTHTSIAVIGGGWAGCTAAVELADAGFHITLFESSRTLGGRARTVSVHDQLLDNGQHILLGAYADTLAQLRKVGVDPESALLRLPLQMRYPAGCDGMDFLAPRLPAPLHMLVALFRASGLARDDKMALARFSTSARWMDWQLNEDCDVLTLLERFDQTERLIRLLWRPLCIAALNTPIEQASAQVFLNVLRDSLGAKKRTASDMLLPRIDLSSLYPERAAAYVQNLGSKVTIGCSIKNILKTDDGWALQKSIGETQTFDGIVLATSPSIASGLLQSIDDIPIPAMTFEPITTCYLQYTKETSLAQPMFALLDDPAIGHWGQFVFDRGQLQDDNKGLLAVVISTANAATDLTHSELIQAVAAQLADALQQPQLAQPLWGQVITEKRATFSCTPSLQRAEEKTAHASFALAGDYLNSPYPATIESAVRSGKKAAALLTEHFA
ncbi:MAG: hydroxysqualene dehydroxylase HpnE [Oxalicibacterium faecigallinarum]|uniref:hydroxysqualene dehydroxylase HpnE n=1 Tax=Oxalicibacterium faecigallinarum TaxID=573741 RepID=UPI0028091E44|nr:hydroxysqualene dehydroxylase HpnE [Oxalicibacterium faecigallinarum]MDQ7969226.1 hydroxysqualene dehydroxylase HpnE [Oxalicibacterium faecigallinarum]